MVDDESIVTIEIGVSSNNYDYGMNKCPILMNPLCLLRATSFEVAVVYRQA